ncbi:MAG: RNA pyrophosphohydrolase [Alphaproteobacteria bacterium]|nr:RNA pyrophosphohydrolase [Alphaproteobacteria bacterium]
MIKHHNHHRNNSDDLNLTYRPGVGMVIFNSNGHVLIAERLDSIGNWQMPQGGIDKDEAPEVAVFREMEEEIGTRNAEIIGMMDEWLHYDFPAHLARKLWEGKYCGQQQKWFAMRFLGQDSDIRLETHTHPEFSQWKWVPIYELLDYIVPFKRTTYERVIKEFARYAEMT